MPRLFQARSRFSAPRCALLLSVLLFTTAHAACPPAGHSRATLSALKSTDWNVADDGKRQMLALALQACLADPDPQLRDELAFEVLSAWMRGGQLQTATLHQIRSTQLAILKSGMADAATASPHKQPQQSGATGGLTVAATSDADSGFAAPFAALTLAEVARVDRKQPFLSKPQRDELVATAAAYLTALRDYRGFDEQAGWRHGVAHSSDLMLQLSLNPALEKAQMQTMLAAIAAQVAPGTHFYQYGEGERLMAPVFYLGRREEIGVAEWDGWFAALLAPLKKGPATQASLALRHNLSGFLLPLYFSLQESGDSAQRQKMLPLVARSLKQIE